MTTIEDEEVGFTIDMPKGWVVELPGQKREYHAPGDYGGKRVTIEVEVLGKLQSPSLTGLYTPQQYASSVADKIKGQNQGASATVLSASERDDGRYYYYSSRLNSLEPQRIWGVAGVGLGQNESARKFKLRQLITVTCKVPEKDLTAADEALLLKITESLQFTR